MSKRNARSMREAGRGGISVSDLPPCHWLPLFAHSVNYYQKAVYIGCSPTLLHILWPIIKGDLHYKPWSPSKKAKASFCFKTYPSTIRALPPDLSVSLSSSHSSNSLAWTCTCLLNCACQAPHPFAHLFSVPFMFALIFFGAVTVQQLQQGKNNKWVNLHHVQCCLGLDLSSQFIYDWSYCLFVIIRFLSLKKENMNLFLLFSS